MSSYTQRACPPRAERRLCTPKLSLCRGGCKPGFCLNPQCPCSGRPEEIYCRPDAEREADFYRQHIEETIRQQRSIERAAFMASERKQMGMPEFKQETSLPGLEPELKDSNQTSELSAPPHIDLNELKGKMRKTLRARARPACMLEVPVICQTRSDYSQLSLFLRTSTMPGYARDDSVSEYRDSHNMAVWNNRKDIDRQVHKLRRDWLSVWGEHNFKEQRGRKAWQEKLAGGGK